MFKYLAFAVMGLSSLYLNADLYDRNKYGVDWRRDNAYGDDSNAPRHQRGQSECPCDPDDPQCPCRTDRDGTVHRID